MDNTLAAYCETEFTLEGLAQAAARMVASARVGQSDGRVAERIDSRGVRYYQTSGLVSKPLRYDGRQAMYGYRHLLQLVAVKLLQADGLSLAQVQQTMTGMPVSQLENVVTRALSRAEAPNAPRSQRPQGRTGTLSAQDHESPRSDVGARAIDVEEEQDGGGGSPAESNTRRLLAEEIAPGVFVTIDTDAWKAPENLMVQLKRCLEGLQGARG